MYHQFQQGHLSTSGADPDTPSTSRATDMDDHRPPLKIPVDGDDDDGPTPMPRSFPSASPSPEPDEKRQNANGAQPLLSGSSTSSGTLPLVWPDPDAEAPHRPHASPSNADESSMTLEMNHEDEEEEEEEEDNNVYGMNAYDDDAFDFGPMQQARAHWIQLHKMDLQMPVLRRTFLRLLQHHLPLRALWPFARSFDGSTGQLDTMASGASFRHFCAAYQATLTMVMDNLDDEPALSRLLQELGSNHFFYDATEAHFKLMREEFRYALAECLHGTPEAMDEELKMDWDALWAKIESNMAFGLALQRHNYLAHCVTATEMHAIRAQWDACLQGTHASAEMDARAARIAERGGQKFMDEMRSFDRVGALDETADEQQQFKHAVHDLLWAIDQAISLWEPGTGFLRLCAEIDGKCGDAYALIRRVGAARVRNPFIQGFSAELEPNTEDATVLHTWTKIYRVAEQAIIADGIVNCR